MARRTQAEKRAYRRATVDYLLRQIERLRDERDAANARAERAEDAVKCQIVLRGDVEERICGDVVSLAPAYLCEECFGLLLSVEAQGACVYLEKGVGLKDEVARWRAEYPDGCR